MAQHDQERRYLRRSHEKIPIQPGEGIACLDMMVAWRGGLEQEPRPILEAASGRALADEERASR